MNTSNSKNKLSVMIIGTFIMTIAIPIYISNKKGVEAGFVNWSELIGAALGNILVYMAVAFVIASIYIAIARVKIESRFDYIKYMFYPWIVVAIGFSYTKYKATDILYTSVVDRLKQKQMEKQMQANIEDFNRIIASKDGGWTIELKEAYRLGIEKEISKSDLPKETKDKFVRCCLDKIVAKYTVEQINKTSKEEIQKLSLECLKELSSKSK